MAQKVITSLIDDVTGEQADETVHFGIDGIEYEIDLTANNAGILRDILADYISAGRKASKTPAGSNGHKPRGAATVSARANRENLAAVREWANRNGYSVSTRGRVSAEVMRAFDQAHGPQLAAAV
jgi:hypothetical protein